MLKRKASLQLSESPLDARIKRPKLAPIVTTFERRPALNVVDVEDSLPSPLDYPWMEWPWDDEEDVDDVDSLFDEPLIVENNVTDAIHDDELVPVASRTAPTIPGLHFDSSLLPAEFASSIMDQLAAQYFPNPRPGCANQVMLFTRPDDTLPAPLGTLLETVAEMLERVLPRETHELLFAERTDGSARQAIVNRYAPGEGISSHVDLVGRYGDGIVGVSLGSGCAMAFTPADDGKALPCELWLPERSVVAFEGAARYDWKHGIAGRPYDVVRTEDGAGDERIERGTRISVTFRWLLPGAHVVGDAD